MLSNQPINLSRALRAFESHWQPHGVSRFNGHDIMVVKVKGEFVWHAHEDTDDFFLVLKGQMVIDLPHGSVSLGPGELYVVSKGVRHRPRAEQETHLLLIERGGTPNTGDPPRTAPR